jgi:hypothetical protein
MFLWALGKVYQPSLVEKVAGATTSPGRQAASCRSKDFALSLDWLRRLFALALPIAELIAAFEHLAKDSFIFFNLTSSTQHIVVLGSPIWQVDLETRPDCPWICVSRVLDLRRSVRQRTGGTATHGGAVHQAPFGLSGARD